uniref:hypothetical protein n=1 Tax=Paractinoplanes polyasparticus TaxID=2856853 RepID=UPI001C85C73F|nr:hypothetical protein [Actinoplanes polyasparticus]
MSTGSLVSSYVVPGTGEPTLATGETRRIETPALPSADGIVRQGNNLSIARTVKQLGARGPGQWIRSGGGQSTRRVENRNRVHGPDAAETSLCAGIVGAARAGSSGPSGQILSRHNRQLDHSA